MTCSLIVSFGSELVSFPSADGFSSLTCSGVFSGVVFCNSGSVTLLNDSTRFQIIYDDGDVFTEESIWF